MSVKRTLGMLKSGAGYGTGFVFLTAGLLIAGLALMPAIGHLNNADHFAAAVRNGAARGVLGLGFATLGFCIMAGTSSNIADDEDGWGTHTDEPGLARIIHARWLCSRDGSCCGELIVARVRLSAASPSLVAVDAADGSQVARREVFSRCRAR